MRTPVTVNDLEVASRAVVDMLAAAIDDDWSVPAGPVEWSCATTVTHIGQGTVHYAAQLSIQAETVHVRVMSDAHPEGTNRRMLELAEAGSALLASAVRAAPALARAVHPYGLADPEGYAAMGCVEVLVHGSDVAAGLGRPLAPPADLCDRILARLFPDQHEILARHGIDSWTGLRYVTGRTQPNGLPRIGKWRWHGDPIDTDV